MSSGRHPWSDRDLRRKVARLVVVRASGHLGDGQRRYPRWELANDPLRQLLELGIGGVILLGGSAAEVALRCQLLRAWAREPLLLCADVEEGVGQRFEGATWLPPPLGLHHLWCSGRRDTALDLARRYGSCTARQARVIGLNWLLAPVCDVNNNPANPVINVRAWGLDPDGAGALAAAFLEGAQEQGVLCCAKHFPGHGDCAVDSHLDLPVLRHDRQRLEQVELPPFRRALQAGVASVMTAHLLLPALDAEQPATLSRPVLHGLLRRQLGFGGLIVTDALVMEAIRARHGPGEAAVLAFSAGADLLLMPEDPLAAIAALERAFRSGRLDPQDLDASLARQARALDGLGAFSGEPQPAIDPDDLRRLETPADRRLLRDLLQAGLDVAGPVPSAPEAGQPPPGPGCNLLRLDTALHAPALPPRSPALLWPAAAGWTTRILDSLSIGPWRADPADPEAPLEEDRLPPGPVLLQLFVRGNPFRGSAGEQDPWGAVVRQLQRRGRLAGLVVYGSPYLWEELRRQLDPTVPGVYCPGQMPAAQGLALQQLGWGDGRGGGAFTD